MRRLVYGFVFALFILTGCRSPKASVPDVSIAAIFPSLPAADFYLADPLYEIYDLSRLRVGMSRAEVRALFSDPRDIKRTPRDEYWEYKWFELYFRDGLLVNWFDLPEAARQRVTPSSRSSRAGL